MGPIGYTHRVISDGVHRLFITLSYFSAGRTRIISSSNTDLNLTLISPSLNRSSVYWFMRVSF